MRTTSVPGTVLILVLALLLPALTGCGGGEEAPAALPASTYATLVYQTASAERPDVFSLTDAGTTAVTAMALLDPVHVPTTDGTWTGALRVVAVPLPDYGILTPDNPITVSVTVTRVGGLVTLVVSYSGQEVFRLDDLALPVGGTTDGVVTDGADTWRYVARPWDEVASSGLLGTWTATGFDDAAALTLDAVGDAAVGATIASRVHTGRRVGTAAFLVGSGSPDSVIILEDLDGAARGYRTSGGGGDAITFDAFTLSRP